MGNASWLEMPVPKAVPVSGTANGRMVELGSGDSSDSVGVTMGEWGVDMGAATADEVVMVVRFPYEAAHRERG
jgi:hypothetical protein